MKTNFTFSAVFLSVMILSEPSFSQSQGPNSPSAAISVPAPGSPWTNPTNVFASDNARASILPLNNYPNCGGQNCYFSTGLQASGFAFTIPLAATIDGIVVEVQRGMVNGTGVVFDDTVKMMKNGAPVGTNYATIIPWSSPSAAYVSYGSPSDLWGIAWSAADINNQNFGVHLSAYNLATNMLPGAMIDHIRITVYYTDALGINSPASSANELFTIHSVSSGQIEANYHLGSSAKGELSILNVLGEIIFSKEISTQGTELIDTRDFPSGVYFVQLAIGEKNHTKKIVIE